MKIALVQLNPIIGNFHHNAGNITAWVEKAKEKDCGLIIFPELALSGYPPQDLLEREAFIQDHEAALERLVSGITGIGVICGVITRHTARTGKPLHNSAVLFEDGRILFTAFKRLLPTYDVFDESRYFEPGNESRTVVYKGLRLGITICEDIWNDKDIFPRPLYKDNPVNDLLAGPSGPLDLLINIASSPFNIGKSALKTEIFTKLCAGHDLPLAYVNQVGGQDSLLFDGRSMAMDGMGGIISRARDFKEDMIVLDTETLTGKASVRKTRTPPPVIDEVPAVFEALVMGTRDYVTKCGFRKGVLGLSGGIDSALTAAIAGRALGPENVLGVALPSPFSSKESVEDARLLAENLGIRFEIIRIDKIFQAHLELLAPLFNGRAVDVTEQNIQARIRGNLLMALSNKFGCMLLSTGNKSEMAVGYCTLYGDMSGGLAVISDVPKQLVYKLARYVNRDREIIPPRSLSKPPSAELAPNQLDQDDLPPYEVLDPILKAYLEENKGVREISAQGYPGPVVEDIIRRIRINEYKRKQAPMGLKVSTKAFGPGRRYPTSHQYTE